MKGIFGLTREVIVGLVANLESRELRRIEHIQRNIKPEHPRSSSTDDVESFISLLHEILGLNFDLKQVFSEQVFSDRQRFAVLLLDWFKDKIQRV